VNASALTGYGVSQGGYWITRAVAFERRMVAAVADPGMVDVSAGWTVHLPKALLGLLGAEGRVQCRRGQGAGQRQPGGGPEDGVPEQAVRRDRPVRPVY
jgi:hypothetical protein